MIRTLFSKMEALVMALACSVMVACSGPSGVSTPSVDTAMGTTHAQPSSGVSALDMGLSLLDSEWDNGSVCFSPKSIRSVLRLAAEGASGETRRQLIRVAGSGSLLREALQPSPGVEYLEANAAWVDQAATLADSYADTLRTKHGATISSLPIRQDAVRSAEQINAWVQQSTRGVIERLLEASDLPSSTDLVLTNAVYFKGAWAVPFDSSMVEDRPFRATAGVRNVPMMQTRQHLRYWETETLQVLQLPYADARYNLVLILPREGQPSNALRGLSADSLASWITRSEEVEVALALPKFRISCLSDVTQRLRGMAMDMPFGTGADFSPMTGGKNGISIGSVLHNAVIEVNEEGSEAAAATGVMMLRASMSQVLFNADRPFAFALYEGDPQNALFVGCYDPQ